MSFGLSSNHCLHYLWCLCVEHIFILLYFEFDNPSFKRIHAVHQPWFAWMIERLCAHKRISVHTNIIFCVCIDSRERKNCNKNFSRIKPIKCCQVFGVARGKIDTSSIFQSWTCAPHIQSHRIQERNCISLWHKFTWFHHDYESFNFSLTFLLWHSITLLLRIDLIPLIFFCTFLWMILKILFLVVSS